ncbi:MAG: acyl-CoA dehydrogenase family protein [Myxococcales bacterium]|nr:acyl-CoA dehydrogenase family protein [Myxococcales bacterium]MCB9521541.1 acyl-CoA dehydrogenase family protein [Myxococcales bacterium]MCB9531740.1 acyl-CoA dehydrogenase family protein [Myxococcales bacterium]MCB9534093.1 acyl-CoA dehydrogenase family protein [Myxococcales bacterium]
MHTAELAAQEPRAVTNQATPFENISLFAHDVPLREALVRGDAEWAMPALAEYGESLAAPHVVALGDLANRHEPELRSFDRFGRRIDVVDFHPSYHELMTLGVEQGVHSAPWENPRPGAHVARGAAMYLRHQVDQGTSCPLTMTFAVVPSLRTEPRVADAWLPKVLARSYDPTFAPVANKSGALFGMAMTERQGGSDVRSNTTRATAIDADTYILDGHKWFCSAPMCDAFLVLAQAPEGLTCFLVPRFLPDGTQQTGFRVNRLKRKLGNRSNASSEIEFHQCWAERVGPPGRGVATIIEMVRHTRLDCALGGASLMRRAVAEAVHHTQRRWTFGRPLIKHDLMRNVVADLLIESEASTALAFRLAAAFDAGDADAAGPAFARAATPVAKYWITHQETPVVREALECIGGNGYAEESPMPRFFRESPLNSIWEGTGNVQVLDFLRALEREPGAADALHRELVSAKGADKRLDAAVDAVGDALRDRTTLELRSRAVVERIARLLQGSLLVRYAPPAVADAFIATRIEGRGGEAFGTLPAGTDLDAILERGALPLD